MNPFRRPPFHDAHQIRHGLIRPPTQIHVNVIFDTANFVECALFSADDAAAEARAKARGEIKGTAESILIILEARGIPVNEAQRQEILSCQDLNRVNRWLRRAAVASSADETTSEP